MINILFFIIGALITLILTKQPLQIKVHHVHENVNPPISDVDLEALEEGMLKEDPKEDDLYSKLDTVLTDVNNIMGGSDR